MGNRKALNAENLLSYQRRYVVNKLRQISRYWPYKNKAKNAAKQQVQCGFYKNGKPKYKNKYKCNHCKDLFDNVEMDHIQPVVNTNDGFRDWNTYINGILCLDSNFQALCENCHSIKTTSENIVRKSRKKVKK